MELMRIIINENSDQHIIFLKEVEGDRMFPIVIGIFEATSIDRRVKGTASPRPLTHDLVTTVIETLGGDLRDIYISELRDHTYFAKLRIRQNGEMVEVDSRPSDAIARLSPPGADLRLRGSPRRSLRRLTARRGAAMTDRSNAQTLLFLLFSFFLFPLSVSAQPTYKFDVKPDLKPRAALSLDGVRVVRTAVTDDPGFRLQYHFKKDGKTVATPEARAEMRVEVPAKEPGTYTVVLELFHPPTRAARPRRASSSPSATP
jgi:bifunctional DNase/RNase